MLKFVFLVGLGLAGTVAVLGAPVMRTRALNVRDGEDILIRRTSSDRDLSEYRLVRRGRPPVNTDNLSRPRQPGHYYEPTTCPHDTCPSRRWNHERFISPIRVDCHCIKFHDGVLPPLWVEPATIPPPTKLRGHRKHPVGVDKQSMDTVARLTADMPAESARLLEARLARAQSLVMQQASAPANLAAETAHLLKKNLARAQRPGAIRFFFIHVK
jgi:hypothetical protein